MHPTSHVLAWCIASSFGGALIVLFTVALCRAAVDPPGGVIPSEQAPDQRQADLDAVHEALDHYGIKRTVEIVPGKPEPLTPYARVRCLGTRFEVLQDTNNGLAEVLNDIWALIYGEEHRREWEYAAQVAAHLRVEFQRVERLVEVIKDCADRNLSPLAHNEYEAAYTALWDARQKRREILERGWAHGGVVASSGVDANKIRHEIVNLDDAGFPPPQSDPKVRAAADRAIDEITAPTVHVHIANVSETNEATLAKVFAKHARIREYLR